MKIKFILYIVTILFSCKLFSFQLTHLRNTKEENDKEIAFRLKTKISKKSTYLIDLKTRDSILLMKKIFNKKGQLIKQEFYKDNDKLGMKGSESYIKEFNNFNIGDLIQTNKLEYNSKGYIVKSNKFTFGKPDGYTIFEHDNNGNTIQSIRYNSKGNELAPNKKYTYNKQNKLTTTLRIYPDKINKGNTSFKSHVSESYRYNRNGKLIKSKTFNYFNDNVSLDEFIYDDNKKTIKSYFLGAMKDSNDKNKTPYSTITEFYNKETLVKKEIQNFYPKSNIYTNVIIYNYDEENNIINENTFRKGNLIKKIVYLYKTF